MGPSYLDTVTLIMLQVALLSNGVKLNERNNGF